MGSITTTPRLPRAIALDGPYQPPGTRSQESLRHSGLRRRGTRRRTLQRHAGRRAGAAGHASRQPRELHRALAQARSEEHTSELQSLMRISYAVFCLKKKTNKKTTNNTDTR